MKTKSLITSILLSIFFVSCSKSVYSEFVWTRDYGKYLEDGFTIIPKEINPSSTGHKFVPVSDILISFFSGKKINDELKNKKGIINKQYKTGTYSDPTIYYYATEERVLDKLVEECKALGANGIVNFKILSKDQKDLVVSGTAVKFVP